MINKNIKMQFNGITIDVTLNNKVNLLSGNSGTGKSLLMKALVTYCNNNDISYRYIDYKNGNISEEQIKNFCLGGDIILLDNADLYLNDRLLTDIIKESKIVVLSLKNTSKISMDSISEYIVNYSNRKLTLEEF